MSDTEPVRPSRLRPRRIAALAVGSAAIAIAITFWLSNAGSSSASGCAAQPDAAALIDAAAQGELAAVNPTAAGRGYADLAFEDAGGKALTIADFAGKALLVNFWASWCIPCREEMPALDRLAASRNGEKLLVLPINLDIGAGGTDKARAFLKQGAWPNLPLYADPSYKAFDRLKANAVTVGLPATLLLDEKGCEIGVLQGPAKWDSPDGERLADALSSLVG